VCQRSEHEPRIAADPRNTGLAAQRESGSGPSSPARLQPDGPQPVKTDMGLMALGGQAAHPLAEIDRSKPATIGSDNTTDIAELGAGRGTPPIRSAQRMLRDSPRVKHR
jgi:hypothetical protein